MSLDDPEVVRAQYATETGLETRRSIYENAEGEDAREVAFQAIAAAHPRRLLEVGAGPGELSARITAELGAEVIALDVSERMVELARGRGVDARVGDVQALPFADASFDTVVAAWMLYHVPDLDRGLAEIARVLCSRRTARCGDELGAAPRGGARPCGGDDGRSASVQPGQRRGDPRRGTSRPSSGSTSTVGSRSPMPRRSGATSAR